MLGLDHHRDARNHRNPRCGRCTRRHRHLQRPAAAAAARSPDRTLKGRPCRKSDLPSHPVDDGRRRTGRCPALRRATRSSTSSASWCTARTRSARMPARSRASHRPASPPTDDIDAIVALDADCVFYTPIIMDVDTVCRLLRSGKNVVTTSGFFHPSPDFREPAEQIRAACADGGASFHGGGIHPGYAGDILPLTLARVMSRIDTIHVYEVVDVLKDAPMDHIDWMGFGKDKDKFLTEPTILGLGLPFFAQSMHMIADGLGVDDRRGDRRRGRRRDRRRGHPARRGRDPGRDRRRPASRMDRVGRRQAAHRLPRDLRDRGPGQTRTGLGLGRDPVRDRDRGRPADRADPQGRQSGPTAPWPIPVTTGQRWAPSTRSPMYAMPRPAGSTISTSA